MNVFHENKKKILFFDGALATSLQKRGLHVGMLPEEWNLINPKAVTGLHCEFLQAGSDFITANTFGANLFKIPDSVLLEKIIFSGIDNAKRAIEQTEKNAMIALDVGPTGKLIEPSGEISFDEAYEAFSKTVVLGEKSGADLILIETMTDTYEMKAAVLAAKENSALPVFATFSLDFGGRLLTGGNVDCCVALLEGLGVDALGINCGYGPESLLPFLERISKISSVPVVVQPNAGIPKLINGSAVFDVSAESFAVQTEQLIKAGAQIVGGCCGTTPEHIAKAVERCKGLSPVAVEKKEITVVSSYAKCCEIGKRPVIIGERINPTGKKRLKQALIEEDYEHIVGLGLTQQENGAEILDVNVGLPGTDEAKAMRKAMKALQNSITLPLQIDSADYSVLETAMRYYNGKALINSVTGKADSMKKIFPLVKKYGGTVVALTLDENGIPETAEGRLAIAKKIITTAAEYGIDKKNIIIDALTLSVSSDANAAILTLDSLSLIKKILSVNTVLGVSNVSFGLPQRDKINSVFFSKALDRGLDAAIINPSSEGMMSVHYSHLALCGLDKNCEKYISVFSGNKGVQGQKETLTLYDAVLAGLPEQAYVIAKREVSERDAAELIENELVKALDEVGKKYESGKFFLPQLIVGSQAAQAAFSAINDSRCANGVQANKGTVVVATVKGDIHDIGKNIAKVMLENYEFKVIDLGKDVEPERVVEAVLKSGAKLAGLSALMTTTVPAMEETIKLLRKKAAECKIMVGGAVLTNESALSIGADFYVPNAMSGVNAAKEVYEKM